MTRTITATHAGHLDPGTPHPRRRLWIVTGWSLVGLLAVHATWQGGIALDLMFAIMKVVGLFSQDEVLPFAPDWLGLLHRSVATGLAVYLATVTLRFQRRTRSACARCGRTGAPGRHLHTWTVPAAWAAAVPALAYAGLKLHWGFGGTIGLRDPALFEGVQPWSPGMGDTAVMALIGVAVAFAMAYGRPRLPRWLLLTPALVGLGLLLPVGLLGTGAMAVALATGVLAGSRGLAPWVLLGVYPTFLTWGVLLAVVTVGYHFRTRGACRRCGRT